MTYITFPLHGSQVNWGATIGGVVTTEVPAVQVYILSNDDKWYLQEHTEMLSEANSVRNWSCDCFFGDEDSPSGSSFVAAVVESAERPHSPTDHLSADEIVDFIELIRA